MVTNHFFSLQQDFFSLQDFLLSTKKIKKNKKILCQERKILRSEKHYFVTISRKTFLASENISASGWLSG